LFVPLLFFFLFSVTFGLRFLLLVLLLRFRLLLHTSGVLLLRFRLLLHTSGVFLLRFRLLLHTSRVLLLRFRLVLHTGVLLLRFRLVLHTGVLFFRGHSSRTWFASFRVGWSSVAALESFLPPAALAMMVFLKKFFVISLTLPVFTPIRILPMETLPVLRLSLIPRQPSRSIPCSGSDNIVGSISIIWAPTVIRAVKIVKDAI